MPSLPVMFRKASSNTIAPDSVKISCSGAGIGGVECPPASPYHRQCHYSARMIGAAGNLGALCRTEGFIGLVGSLRPGVLLGISSTPNPKHTGP